MQATISNIKEFTKLMTIVSTFDTSFIIKCTSDGLSIFCLDTARTSIVEVDLPVQYFKQYQFNKNNVPIQLGINVTVLLSTLKAGGKNDVLHILAEADSDKMRLQMDGEDNQMLYEIKLMNIEEETMEIPDLEYNIKMNLKTKKIKDWKTYICDYTGSHIDFSIEDEKMILKSSSSSGSVTSTLCHGDTMSVFLADSPKGTGLGMKSIALASKMADVVDECQMGWTNDAPISFIGKIGTDGVVKMWFAPVMNDEDEDEDMG